MYHRSGHLSWLTPVFCSPHVSLRVFFYPFFFLFCCKSQQALWVVDGVPLAMASITCPPELQNCLRDYTKSVLRDKPTSVDLLQYSKDWFVEKAHQKRMEGYKLPPSTSKPFGELSPAVQLQFPGADMNAESPTGSHVVRIPCCMNVPPEDAIPIQKPGGVLTRPLLQRSSPRSTYAAHREPCIINASYGVTRHSSRVQP